MSKNSRPLVFCLGYGNLFRFSRISCKFSLWIRTETQMKQINITINATMTKTKSRFNWCWRSCWLEDKIAFIALWALNGVEEKKITACWEELGREVWWADEAIPCGEVVCWVFPTVTVIGWEHKMYGCPAGVVELTVRQKRAMPLFLSAVTFPFLTCTTSSPERNRIW